MSTLEVRIPVESTGRFSGKPLKSYVIAALLCTSFLFL